jgi:hypothetical protein
VSTGISTELDIALQIFSGTDSVTVKLMNDAGGLPGGDLEAWSVNGLAPIFTCCTLQALPGLGTLTLSSGTTYWVAAFPAADTLAVWNDNTTGVTGTRAAFDGSGWNIASQPDGTTVFTTGAFAILGAPGPGTAVPEPGTGALALAAGVLALMMRRPVPEPS